MVSLYYPSLKAEWNCLRKLGNLKRRKYICKVLADKGDSRQYPAEPPLCKIFLGQSTRWTLDNKKEEEKRAHAGHCKERENFDPPQIILKGGNTPKKSKHLKDGTLRVFYTLWTRR